MRPGRIVRAAVHPILRQCQLWNGNHPESSVNTDMTRIKTLIATAMIATALATEASAHSLLKSSAPAADSSVAAVEQVELTFSGSVNPRFSNVTISSVAGEPVKTGKADVSADGHTLLVPLSAPLSAGQYTVNWDALSKDGHKVNGKFSFSVE